MLREVNDLFQPPTVKDELIGGEEMVTVDQYAYGWIGHRVYGKGIRQVARETERSRNTIKKALREEYEGYGVRRRRPYPIPGPYLGMIDGWLTEDRDRPLNRRHTAAGWLDYADQKAAPLRRSSSGPITTITQWLHSSDQQHHRKNDRTPSSLFIPGPAPP